MDKSDYKDIRKRVERLYDLRSEYFSHLIAFLTLNGLILWSVNNTPTE
jgi:hypothetical protein